MLAENVLRRAPQAEVAPALAQIVEGRAERDIPFYPARVVLQDLLGTPALVDLAEKYSEEKIRALLESLD